jgi:hypothetical protein
MRTDGQTNMKKLIVRFPNFAEAPQNEYWSLEETRHLASVQRRKQRMGENRKTENNNRA